VSDFIQNVSHRGLVLILIRFIIDLDRQFRRQRRDVCLTLDNFSGHYINYEPTNIELLYFEPNLTSHVQPLDAGIIRCFKARYRKMFCEQALLLDATNAKNIWAINLHEAMIMAREAWDGVTAKTIEHCWRHAGISPDK
jgi:hypothetical protein